MKSNLNKQQLSIGKDHCWIERMKKNCGHGCLNVLHHESEQGKWNESYCANILNRQKHSTYSTVQYGATEYCWYNTIGFDSIQRYILQYNSHLTIQYNTMQHSAHHIRSEHRFTHSVKIGWAGAGYYEIFGEYRCSQQIHSYKDKILSEAKCY